MTLQAILIRADGALAETENVRYAAFGQVFAEAGFDWSVNPLQFAETAALACSSTRMAHYVRRCLKGRPETADLSQLIQAMHRRASKLFGEKLESGVLEPRSGVRELIVEARKDGLRLALVSSLKGSESQTLLRRALGSWALDAFQVLIIDADRDIASATADVYRRGAAALGVSARCCLVIEATPAGASAAIAAGLPVIVTRSAYCPDGPTSRDVEVVLDDLPSLINRSVKPRIDPLSADDRAELLTALQVLHAGNCKLVDLKRSDQMRVSDILKTKGSAVKTIEPTATMRAFAHGLKTEAVGAMPVQAKGGAVQGIISERDMARGLAEFGADLPAMRVSELMTTTVVTCAPDDSVSAVAKIMTQRRIRHVPVVVNGQLVGLVSIGDVLKHRLDEVQLEANVLRDFAIARR